MAAWLLIVLLGAVGVALAATVSAAARASASSAPGDSRGRHGLAWGATLLVAGGLLTSVATYQSPGSPEARAVSTRSQSVPESGNKPRFIAYEPELGGKAEVPIVPSPSREAAEKMESTPGEATTGGKAVELPDWTKQEVVRERSRTLATVAGRQFSTVEEARADALAEAVKLFDAALRQDGRYGGEWTTPAEFVEQHAIHRSFVEPVTHSTPKNTFQVFRVYLQVNVSPRVIAAFEREWEQQQLLARSRTVSKRLWTLGSGVALASLVFATIAGYLRLDERTHGAYRTRLKTAAASLLAAGGLAAAIVMHYV